LKDRIRAKLEDAYVKSKSHEFKAEDWETEGWEEMRKVDRNVADFTGVQKARL